MKIQELFLLISVSFIFTFPFFQKGYFKTDDGEWAIVRLTEMRRELNDLQLPPRWADYLNHGYGYPLFLFTYPFPYYLGVIFKVMGLSFTDSIKAVFVLSTFVSAFAMYFFSKRYWGDFGAVVSSILYIIVPYRLVDLYIRGSIGEIVAMAIFPLLLWQTDKLIHEENKNTFLVSFLFLFLIISHNASALFFSFVLLIYLVFRVNLKKLKRILIPFFQGLLLSSSFWLPAILEKKYIYLGHFPLADKKLHFASISELLFFNTRFSSKPPLFIGIIHLFGILIAFMVMLIFKKKTQVKTFLTINLITVLFSTFLLFPLSSIFWKLPLLSEIDFPWRILVIISFLLSFISGSVVFLPKGKLLGAVLIILGIILNHPFVRVQNRFIKEDSYYETNDATTTSSDELTPIWVVEKPRNRSLRKVEAENAHISNLQFNSQKIEFLVNSYEEDTEISVNTLYFPGWRFWINNREIEIYPSKKTGIITFNSPKGVYKITGKFTKTPVRILADYLSILGLLSIIIYNKKFFQKRFKK